MILAQGLWLTLVCLLGVWWCRLALNQAEQIGELQAKLGVAAATVNEQLFRTERMLFWESVTYIVLVCASTALVAWLYWRDMMRARAIQAFFASMTHELRTPLTSIRLQAESIADNEGGQNQGLTKRLLEDTMRLESQVERSLELARVEGGGPVFPQAIELKPWIEHQIRGFEEAYGGQVKFKSLIEPFSIMADPTSLQIVFKNVIENSLRHAKRDDVLITLTNQLDGQGVALKFRDNGGVFKGDPRKLGELFQKGSASQGAGVGLYLIRVLTEQMGGRARFGINSKQPGFEVEVWLRSEAKGVTHG